MTEPAHRLSSGLPAFIAGAVLLGGAAVFAYSVLSQDAAPPPKAGGGWGGGSGPSGPTPVRVHDVQVGSLTAERKVPGELFVTRQGALRARVAGEVDRVPHRLGALVERGALLVGLDTGTLPAEVRRAEALVQAASARKTRAHIALQQAQRELARRQELAGQGAVSRAELDRSKTDVALAEAELALQTAEEARARADVDVLVVQLGQTRVTAPFKGRVGEMLVEEGATVTAGQHLATLVADEVPRARFALGETEAAGLELGAPVVVRLGAVRLEGEVSAIGAAVNVESRTLPVEATLKVPPELKSPLLPGSYVEVEVAMGATEATTLVPVEALQGKGAVRKLFVIEEGKARAVEARVLLEDGQHAAVAGVTEGQRIVVSGGDTLKDGTAVEVVQ